MIYKRQQNTNKNKRNKRSDGCGMDTIMDGWVDGWIDG